MKSLLVWVEEVQDSRLVSNNPCSVITTYILAVPRVFILYSHLKLLNFVLEGAYYHFLLKHSAWVTSFSLCHKESLRCCVIGIYHILIFTFIFISVFIAFSEEGRILILPLTVGSGLILLELFSRYARCLDSIRPWWLGD